MLRQTICQSVRKSVCQSVHQVLIAMLAERPVCSSAIATLWLSAYKGYRCMDGWMDGHNSWPIIVCLFVLYFFPGFFLILFRPAFLQPTYKSSLLSCKPCQQYMPHCHFTPASNSATLSIRRPTDQSVSRSFVRSSLSPGFVGIWKKRIVKTSYNNN